MNLKNYKPHLIKFIIKEKCLKKQINCFGMLLLIGEALRDVDNCEFVSIYEDKDGDWMLAGDIPWE